MNPRNPAVDFVGGLVFLGVAAFMLGRLLLRGPSKVARGNIDSCERQARWIGRNPWLIRAASPLLVSGGVLGLLRAVGRLGNGNGDWFVPLVAGTGMLAIGVAAFACPARLARWQHDVMCQNATRMRRRVWFAAAAQVAVAVIAGLVGVGMVVSVLAG